MPDEYGVTAEFHDVLTADHAALINSTLQESLVDCDPAAGPVVDLGAGTGLVTEAIAEIVPDARIIAVEPAAAMRAALMTRLAGAGLLERVTVRPAGALDGVLPERIGGLTAFAMLGHLDAISRAELWRELARRLAPGAPAVVQVLPPHAVQAVPLTLFGSGRVGDDVVEGWGAAEVLDDQTVQWRMTYRVTAGEGVLREEHANYVWHPLQPDDVLAEAARGGLAGVRVSDDVVVLRVRR